MQRISRGDTVKHATCHLYFLLILTRLKARVYTENTKSNAANRKYGGTGKLDHFLVETK